MEKKIVSRIVAVVAVCFMMIGVSTLTVSANTVSVANEAQLRAAVGQAGSTPTIITLTADIELISNFSIPTDSTLIFRSSGETMYRLIAIRDMTVVGIGSTSSLTLENVEITRTSETRGNGVSNGGTFIMNGGMIRGNNNGYGVSNTGEFIMNSGTISDNTGGGVSNNIHWRSGRFTMNGGAITNNSGGHAGGVYNRSTFIMNGGNISNNRAQIGGGIRNAFGSVFIMNNGTISGNFAEQGQALLTGFGGGVYNIGRFTMYNGTISNNWAARLGSGVLNTNESGGGRGQFTMHGGNISGNHGEGVYNSASTSLSPGSNEGPRGAFTMNGGTISNNSQGGVTTSSRFVMTGGTIRNNQINGRGAGVLIGGRGDVNPARDINASFVMLGGTIQDNVASEGGGGVHHSSGNFTFDGGWIFNNIAEDISIAQRGNFRNNVFDINIGAIGSGPPAGVAASANTSIPTILPPLENISSGPFASPTSAAVTINGAPISFAAYNIAGANYFRLRDVAYALNGTGSQFNVAWSESANAITILPGQAYIPIGGEMAAGSSASVTATPAEASVLLDATPANLTAYNIGGSNFFMLRDLGNLLGFFVIWDAAANTIQVTTL